MPRVEEVTAKELVANEQAMSFLSRQEASNNVVIGYARCNDPKTPTRFFVLYKYSSDEESAVVGAAMMTKGFPVLMGFPISVEGALAIEEYLHEEPLKGVNGPEEASSAFAAKRNSRQVGADDEEAWELDLSIVCYEATPESLQMVSLDGAKGAVRWLKGDSEEDLQLLQRLAHEFGIAIGNSESHSIGENSARRLKEGLGKFLVVEKKTSDDNGTAIPCALCGSVRETEHYGVISMVYTPSAHRRQGWAGKAVSAMAQHLLLDKQRIALFADAEETGPNKLYQSLGFSAVSITKLWK